MYACTVCCENVKIVRFTFMCNMVNTIKGYICKCLNNFLMNCDVLSTVNAIYKDLAEVFPFAVVYC